MNADVTHTISIIIIIITFQFISSGATAAGTATVAPALAMAIVTKENTNSINATAAACIRGTMDAFTMAVLPKTNVTDRATASLPGPTGPFTTVPLTMDNAKAMANIPLPMEDSTMVVGRMDGMMDLEPVRGKTDGDIRGNGEMVWRMGKERKRIQMAMCDMKDNGWMMSLCVKENGWHH
jgi:hypothetical protein